MCPRLRECEVLVDGGRDGIGRIINGGDHLVAACVLQLLGDVGAPRCHSHIHGALFRPFPPWVAPWMVGAALEADKMCRARKTKTSCVLSMPAEPFGDWHKWTTRYEKTIDWVPNDAAATWHRVLPTARDGGVGWDRRCSIWVDLHPTSGLVTQQLSRCAPHFVIAGAPKGGTTSLFAYLLQHPEIVRPRRKELRFFAPITRPLTRVSVSHATRLKYMNLFPQVDPRDFKLTGEASPAYLYHDAAAALFASHLRTTRVVLLLRDPAERTFSEFKNKRDNGGMLWVGGVENFETFTLRAHASLRECGLDRLYLSQALLPNATSSGEPFRCTVPPALFQSWYHLVLPKWLPLGPRLHVDYSETLYNRTSEVVNRIAGFLELSPGHAFDTQLAYNTDERRGANAPRDKDLNNAQKASERRARGSEMSDEQHERMRALLGPSAAAVAAQLRADGRTPPPPSWLRRAARTEEDPTLVTPDQP